MERIQSLIIFNTSGDTMGEPVSEKVIESRMMMHSCYVRGKGSSAVVVKEKIKYTDGSIVPNTVVFQNPKRNFYVTKPQFRTYTSKPEYELMSRLDRYTCYDHELSSRIAEVFDLDYGWIPRDTLFKSPYIFGADISIEALIKMRYLEQWPDAGLEPTVGYLDIETSIDTKQIILISYAHDNVVHTAILESFLFEEIGDRRVAVPKDELRKYVQENLASRTRNLVLTYDIEVFDNEMKIIAWIFKHIHAAKMDFISIWNMNFDVPRIVKVIEAHRYKAANFFSDPTLEYRYYKYYEDPKNVAHFTLKWHWAYSTCTSQMVDSMGLFSQCRKTAGYRDKYDLNSILKEEIQQEKLPLAAGSHTMMQRHHFKDYVVYNIFDVVGLRLLEDKNKDFLTLCILSGPTPVNKFNAQTSRSTNSIYRNAIGKGQVLSSCSGEDPFLKYEKLFPNVGGAVLNPSRVRGVGIELSV